MQSLTLANVQFRARAEPRTPSGFDAAVRRLAEAVSRPKPRPWFLLDDRLLQDGGISPREAEIARLEAYGPDPAAIDPIANHGLPARDFSRRIREAW